MHAPLGRLAAQPLLWLLLLALALILFLSSPPVDAATQRLVLTR